MKSTITIQGKTYPCYSTMGAMLKYKHLSGNEASSIGTDVAEMVTYLYCMTTCACDAEGVDAPPFDCQGFANRLSPEEFNRWATGNDSPDPGNTDADSEPGEKKSPKQ